MSVAKSSIPLIWDRAISIVNDYGHDEMDTCHLLMAMLGPEDDPASAVLLKYCHPLGMRCHDGRMTMSLHRYIIGRYGYHNARVLDSMFGESNPPPWTPALIAVRSHMTRRAIDDAAPGSSFVVLRTSHMAEALLLCDGPHTWFMLQCFDATGVSRFEVATELGKLSAPTKNVVIIE